RDRTVTGVQTCALPIFGGEGGERDDGSEDLLLEDPGVGADIGEDGGLNEVSGLEPLRASAAGDEAGLGLADLDVGHDLLEVLGEIGRASCRARVDGRRR